MFMIFCWLKYLLKWVLYNKINSKLIIEVTRKVTHCKWTSLIQRRFSPVHTSPQQPLVLQGILQLHTKFQTNKQKQNFQKKWKPLYSFRNRPRLSNMRQLSRDAGNRLVRQKSRCWPPLGGKQVARSVRVQKGVEKWPFSPLAGPLFLSVCGAAHLDWGVAEVEEGTCRKETPAKGKKKWKGDFKDAWFHLA